MSPAVQKAAAEIRHAEKRRFRAAVLFGIAIAFFIAAVSFTLYTNVQQEVNLDRISECITRPHLPQCIEARNARVAVSVDRTEACYISALAGYECKPPLGSAHRYRKQLLGAARQDRSTGGTNSSSPTSD